MPANPAEKCMKLVIPGASNMTDSTSITIKGSDAIGLGHHQVREFRFATYTLARSRAFWYSGHPRLTTPDNRFQAAEMRPNIPTCHDLHTKVGLHV